MEKFVIKKAQRFRDQNSNLCLPAFELVYVWNGFRILSQQYSLVERVYTIVEKKMKETEKKKGQLLSMGDTIESPLFQCKLP